MKPQSLKIRAHYPLAGDQVGVSRSAVPITPVAVKVGALGLILSDLAAMALSPDRASLAAHDAALTTSLTTLQLLCNALAPEQRKEVDGRP